MLRPAASSHIAPNVLGCQTSSLDCSPLSHNHHPQGRCLALPTATAAVAVFPTIIAAATTTAGGWH